MPPSAASADRDLRRTFAGHVCAYTWWLIFCGPALVGAGARIGIDQLDGDLT